LDQFGTSIETRGILFAIVSVIFAILGLRSLYFVLDALTRYLVFPNKDKANSPDLPNI
jgi:predicted tellurium resistance membrane protein TerC